MAAANDSPSSSRALVPLKLIKSDPHLRRTPRLAPFLAQVIASAKQLPQTRERRRAEPEDAIAAHKAAIARIQKMNAAQ